MKTIPIRYIGKTPTNIDPILSLTWEKGETKDIEAEPYAAWLLYYSESFADARPKAKQKADPVEPRERKQGDIKWRVEEATPNLSIMQPEALKRFAIARFNFELPDVPLPEMRQMVQARMRRLGL